MEPEAVLNLGNFCAEHENLSSEQWEAHLGQTAVTILRSYQELPEELEYARRAFGAGSRA